MGNNKKLNGVNALSDKGLKNILGTCAVCGRVKTEDNEDNFRTAYYNGVEETICDVCLFDNKDGYEFCDSCKLCYCLKPSSELHLVYGVGNGIEEYNVCDEYIGCYVECKHCGRDFYEDNVHLTDDNEYLCPECYEEYLETIDYENN